MRRELRVGRQLWTPPKGQPFLKTPKTSNSSRTVALSSLVTDTLSAHLAIFGTGNEGFVFHIDGRPVVRAMASKYIRAAGVPANWHDLRHHHTSVLLSAGMSPALVAERLGHDVKTLLATYARVIRTDEDRLRAIVDSTLGGSAEDWLRTEAS